MAASSVNSRQSSTRKRSHEDGDIQDAKRLKTPSGDSELSLRGGADRSGTSPSGYKRGVVRPPTDDEWRELMATGFMTGVNDLDNPTIDPDIPNLIDIDAPELPAHGDQAVETAPTEAISTSIDKGKRGSDRGSTYRGSKVNPIPINLPSSTPVKSTPAKSAQPSTGTPSQVAFTNTPVESNSTPTKTSSRQSTSARPTQAIPSKTTLSRDQLSSDDFDISTPFSTAMDESTYKEYASHMGFLEHPDFDDYLEYIFQVSNPVPFSQWREIQKTSKRTGLPGRRDTSGTSAALANAIAGAGGGNPGDDHDHSSSSDSGGEGVDGSHGGSAPPSPPPPPPPPPCRVPSLPRSPERPSSAFTEDHEILQKWTALETMIEQYVEECIAWAMPENIDIIDNSPYEVFRYLAGDDHAYMMCRNPDYSPYLFQITIWNYLLSTLFSRGSSTWAADMDKSTDPPTLGQGSGLGLATDYATVEVMLRNDQERSYENRMRFFVFRKETADYIYEYLVNDQNYATLFDETCQELMYMFTGYFKPDYANGTEETWTELLRLTTDVVSAAWNLAILMRRSDGVWDAFLLAPESAPYRGCVQLHQRVDLAAPPDQDRILPESIVTMCVVPGLVKHEVVPDCSRGPDGSRVRTMRRVCAKVFVDLGEDDVRPLSDYEEEGDQLVDSVV